MKKTNLLWSFVLFAGCLFGGDANNITENNGSNNATNNGGSNNGGSNNGMCACLESVGDNEIAECGADGECIYTCEVGFFNCDGSPGCEFAETSESCGCADVCEFDNPESANATPFCDTTAEFEPICVPICEVGTLDDNGVFGDGCETDCVVSNEEDVPGDGVDSDCDGVDGDLRDIYFVDFTRLESGPGDADGPANNFSVTTFSGSGKAVVVFRGDGNLPLIEGLNDVQFYGGYDQNWLKADLPTRIENTEPNRPALAVLDSDELSFENIAFVAIDVSVAPQFSRAVDLKDSAVRFTNCAIEAADILAVPDAALDGVVGNPGVDGLIGIGAGGGPAVSNSGVGGKARAFPGFAAAEKGADGDDTAGLGGSGGSGGQNAATGGSPGNGGIGGIGGTGGLGSQNEPLESYLMLSPNNTIVPYRLIVTTNSGHGGSGAGGGGGGGGGTVEGFSSLGRGGSSGGGGGRGGLRGESGITGTSTVGLVLRGSSAVIDNNVEIKRGIAGDGGLGGIGGCGGLGGAGGPIDLSQNINAGLAGAGGRGGHGGHGSHGPAGNGGLSIGVLRVNNNDSVSDFDQTGGSGGVAGIPQGAFSCSETATIIAPAPSAFDGHVLDRMDFFP